MLEIFRKQPLLKFLLIAFTLYLIWYFVYETFIHHPHTNFDRYLSISLVHMTDVLLSVFGYDVELNYAYAEVTIKLSDSPTNGVWVGPQCNGIELFALFAIYIVAFPGKWITKSWFIPAGILIIQVINTIRIAALTVIERDAPETLDFNHNYTFQIIVYGFVFYLWYLWTSRYSGLKINPVEKN